MFNNLEITRSRTLADADQSSSIFRYTVFLFCVRMLPSLDSFCKHSDKGPNLSTGRCVSGGVGVLDLFVALFVSMEGALHKVFLQHLQIQESDRHLG